VPRARPATLDDMGEALSEALQTRVRVTMGKRKGHVVIECGSRDDLQRVCQGLLGRTDGAERLEPDAFPPIPPEDMSALADPFAEEALSSDL
jgi:hypothetical protein